MPPIRRFVVIALALAAASSVSCDAEEYPPRTECSIFLECYLDCRDQRGAFEDNAVPEVNGVTPEEAHAVCYASCADEATPPDWLFDELYPVRTAFLFRAIRSCINPD